MYLPACCVYYHEPPCVSHVLGQPKVVCVLCVLPLTKYSSPGSHYVTRRRYTGAQRRSRASRQRRRRTVTRGPSLGFGCSSSSSSSSSSLSSSSSSSSSTTTTTRRRQSSSNVVHRRAAAGESTQITGRITSLTDQQTCAKHDQLRNTFGTRVAAYVLLASSPRDTRTTRRVVPRIASPR